MFSTLYIDQSPASVHFPIPAEPSERADSERVNSLDKPTPPTTLLV